MTNLLVSLKRHLWKVIGLAAIAAGCGGNSCSCAGPIPNGFPAAERVPNSMQVRVTDRAITFFENNAGALVNSLVPGGLSFAPPMSSSNGVDICQDPCGQITASIQNLALTPVDPPGDRLDLNLQLSLQTAPPHILARIIGADCVVDYRSSRSGTPYLTITGSFVFSEDSIAGTTRVDFGNTGVGGVDSGDISISGDDNRCANFITCGIQDLACKAFDFLGAGTIADALGDGINDALSGAVSDQFCKSCTTDAECAPYASCSGSTCMVDTTTRCLQEIGTTGRMTARSVLGSMGPSRKGATDFYDIAGGYAKTNNNGISLGFLGGAVAGDGFHDECVPVVPPPPIPGGMLAESTTFQGNTRPDGVGFDIGIGLHEYFLDRFFWALYDSGSMCADVGEATSDQINSATFGLLAPSMANLFHGQVSKIALLIRPKQAPDVTLGAGTFTMDGNIDEPLMTLTIPKMDIDIYGQVDERFVRLLTVETDVTIPLGLEPDGMGQLLPVLGDLSSAFTNVTVTNSDLLTEPEQELADKFPTLLSIAIGGLGGALDPIALPDVSGIKLEIPPGGITSIDNNTMLAIFADLAVAMRPAPADTTVEVLAVNMPEPEAFTARVWDPTKRPTIELAFGATAPEAIGTEFEWQFRVDNTNWSPFTRQSNILLSRGAFWLQARHKIEVRARVVGIPRTTDPESAVVYVLIDTMAPTMELRSDGQTLIVDASDIVSKPEQLLVEYRVGNTSWTSAGPSPASIAIGELDFAALEVRVTDEAGNVGVGTGEQINFHGRVPADDGCNCAVGQAGPTTQTGSGLAVLAFFSLLMLAISHRGRRLAIAAGRAMHRRALHVLVLVAVAAPGCNCSKNPGLVTPDPSNLPALTGRYNDSAAIAGRVLISVYDQKFGDMVVIELDPAELTFDIVSVDGVPNGPVADPDEPYRNGVTAPGANVGQYSSIIMVFDQGRIAYKDSELGGIRFATEITKGEWQFHLVDDGTVGEAGFYNSLAANTARTQLGIAYLATGIDDGNGGKTTQLRWARSLTPSPQGPTDWAIETVSEVSIPCAGFCGMGEQCEAASNTCKATDTMCPAECAADVEACIASACTAILPKPRTFDIPEGTGLFASAGFLPDDRAVIAYYDRNAGDLMIAVRETDSSWTITPIDSDPMTDVGQWVSMVVDPSGALHMAYQDAGTDRLLYAKYANDAVVTIEVIDDGARAGDRPHPVGASVELLLEAAGPMVIYQDQALSDVMTATRNSDGTWTTSELLAGEIGYGFYISAASDGTDVWVSNYFYDTLEPTPGTLGVVALP